MAPLVRRTWSLRGHRPELLQKGKHREKVSLALAFWLSPAREHLGLVYRTLVNDYFNNEQVAVFLEVVMRELPYRLVVLWDGGNMHKGDPIRAALQRFRPRLTIEKLPAWAPMIDPAEPVFSWLKYGRLCNYAPANAQELNKTVLAELRAVDQDQGCLRNLWHGSELPLPKPLN